MLLMFMVSVAITACHKQLQWTQEHMQKIKEERDPFESWLDGLFGETGSWLKQLLKVFAIGYQSSGMWQLNIMNLGNSVGTIAKSNTRYK